MNFNEIKNRFHTKTITINSAHSNDDDETLRELIFRNYFRYDQQQEQILDDLLRKRFIRNDFNEKQKKTFKIFVFVFLRYELAKICGYSSYSHRALDNTLLNKPEHVTQYLEQIMDAIRPLADRDIKLMQILKNRLQSKNQNQQIAPWDVARLEGKFKSEVYVIS